MSSAAAYATRWHTLLTDAYRRGCVLLPGDTDVVTPFAVKVEVYQVQDDLYNIFNRKGKSLVPGLRGSLGVAEREGYVLPRKWMELPDIPAHARLERAIQLYLHFPVDKFLPSLGKHLYQPQFERVPTGVLAIINYLQSYAIALHQAGSDALLQLALPDTRLLAHRPPSEQLLEIFLMQARVIRGGTESEADLDLLVGAAIPSVRHFFRKARKHFERLFQVRGNAKSRSLGHKLRREFAACCWRDHDYALLDVLARGDWPEEPPTVVTALLNHAGTTGPLKKSSIFQRIADHSARQARPDSGSDQADAPRFDVTTLTSTERKEILRAVREHPIWSPYALEWQTARYATLLDYLLGPLIRWDAHQDSLVPVISAPYDAGLVKNYQNFVDTRNAEAREIATLRKQLDLLALAPSEEIVDRYAFAADFQQPVTRARWQAAVERRRGDIRRRDRYREDKRREYGMTVFHGRAYVRDLYLDELLRIEKEVTPFVPFVKQAFRAALPARTDVSFDTGRHALDGPEFDPDTLTQPDKYLRGEVMKTFREGRKEIRIEQVNAFCLDYSRSMTHIPMRNLFKLIFLLILGLEDRSSYDAIYFFDNEFHEVAHFEARFTNRKLLFRMLQTVAEPSGMRLQYRGRGYTDISNAIRNSCERVTEFSAEHQATQPDVHIVRSLFVITDGEPTGGIIEPDALGEFIEAWRTRGNLTVKGIYLNTGDNVGQTIRRIFGPRHTTATETFGDAAVSITQLIAGTYREQRRVYRRNTRQTRTA